MRVLVTGAAGFIGFHVVQTLLKKGHVVCGIDNINDYYDIRLKHARLSECGIVGAEALKCGDYIKSSTLTNFTFVKCDISDKEQLNDICSSFTPDVFLNLAAQAGVRYSITNPDVYIQSNLVGFANVLEVCRNLKVQHLVYASSSSVYGMNNKIPFSEDDIVITPVSLYAATKKSNELMAHSYSKLYSMRTTGLRYFTVYGPYGRPDMAPMIFASAIDSGNEIKLFNNGDMLRDFTYIDDVVAATVAVVESEDIDKDDIPYEIYNVGCGKPENLSHFIKELENNFGVKANKILYPMQPGDVCKTYADTSKLKERFHLADTTPMHEGVALFCKWFNSDKNPLK